MSTLPNGWVPVTIAAISESIQYGHTASAVERETGPRFLRITDIQDGQVDWSTVPSCNLTKDELPKYQLKPGDLVFARTGATTGKSFLIRHCPDAVFASYLIRVRVSSEMDERFLALFFQSPDYWRQIEGGKRGVGQPNVNGTILGKVQFSLPPLAEQRRIVGKVEELFSELDEGVANLKQARAQLAVYRQALLKHAFEGHLTADWRSKHAPELESADQLLARIRAEQEERYERELKEWKKDVSRWEKSGSIGRRPSKPSAIVASEAISEGELDLLRDIPSEWVWTRVEDLGVVQLGRQRSPKNESKKYPTKYIRAANITEDGLSLEDVKDMEFLPHELENYRLVKGDLVLSEASGSASQVGKPAMWNDQIPDCCFQNTVIRHRPHLAGTGSYLLALYKFFYSSGMFARVSGGVGINHLSANKFAAIPVPLAPLAEQERIVAEVDRALSAVSALEADIDLNLQKAEALRQSILKKAFAGELVPQDPADEPADALLARIRAEREAATAQSAKKKPATPRRAKA